MKEQINLIVPTIAGDVYKIFRNKKLLYKYLPIQRIYIIGNAEVEEIIKDETDLEFIDESKLVNFEEVKSFIVELTANDTAAVKRTGWYVQQFIKLAYSRICSQAYYLIWDSDTIPVHMIDFFDSSGAIYLDTKTEYHKPYFKTISNLFDGLQKQIDRSFITEHMLIKTEHMKNMLNYIESSEMIKGGSFIERILRSIDKHDIQGAGFSEFETYGTYVYKNYHEQYLVREWRSLRSGGFFWDLNTEIPKNDIFWLGKSFDAVSMEKNQRLTAFTRTAKNSIIKRMFSSRILLLYAFIARGMNKICKK